MYLSTFDEIGQVSPGLIAIEAASLNCAFEKVKGGRKKKGKRYPLALILTVLMLGKMAGEKTVSGIVDWVKERENILKRQLNGQKRFPVNSTYSEVLAHCDGQAIAQAIAQVILKARAEEQRERNEQILHKSLKYGDMSKKEKKSMRRLSMALPISPEEKLVPCDCWN